VIYLLHSYAGVCHNSRPLLAFTDSWYFFMVLRRTFLKRLDKQLRRVSWKSWKKWLQR